MPLHAAFLYKSTRTVLDPCITGGKTTLAMLLFKTGIIRNFPCFVKECNIPKRIVRVNRCEFFTLFFHDAWHERSVLLELQHCELT